MDEKDIQELIRQLNDPSPEVRMSAAGALGEVALNGKNITSAIPALGNALSDKNGGVRKCAAEVLWDAASNDQDISLVVPALGHTLNDEDRYVKWSAAGALTYHYVNKGQWTKVEELLAHEGAARALKEPAEKGRDITPVVPALVKILKDGNEMVRKGAAQTLMRYGFNKISAAEEEKIRIKINVLLILEEKVREFLGSMVAYCAVCNRPGYAGRRCDCGAVIRDSKEKNIFDIVGKNEKTISIFVGFLVDEVPEVRNKAAEVFRAFINEQSSVKQLCEIQKVLENSFLKWKGKQRQGRTADKITMEIRISTLLTLISDKKAKLAKKDGELLLGETVKKPKDKDKKIYRSLRRVGRNG